MQVLRHQIHPDVFTPEELDKLLRAARKQIPQLRGSPLWLGDFQMQKWELDTAQIPGALVPFVAKLASVAPPPFPYNYVFLQRYEVGEGVRWHRDPRNNLWGTLIAPFGEYTGAETSIRYQPEEEAETCQVLPGTALWLPCTVSGRQGPHHSVSNVTSGERWALILNTIHRES